jgi:glycine dehydrogenase
MTTRTRSDTFADRHIGASADERDRMLAAIGAASLDALVDEVVPADIRLRAPLDLPEPESEHEYLRRLAEITSRNRVCRSYIGLGYHDTVTPSVVLRMVMENPGWYTPYTPYQAEIAQGRLESLLNFQTVVSDLTAMDLANASLLDEATAAAEAMALMHRVGAQEASASGPRHVCLVSDGCLPQTIDVLRSRAEPQGIEIVVAPPGELPLDDHAFSLILQYPDAQGRIDDLAPIISRAHSVGIRVAVGADLLALALISPPGDMGADVVFGNSQRFGVPLGFGGPHAAFFATRTAYVRQVPGRVIGVSVDAHGKPAYRMALATREQHIRREKATSNVCTAQALLANMAAMYAVYHGPDGLRSIASRIHAQARVLEAELARLGVRQLNPQYFDTLCLEPPASRLDAVRERALAAGINYRYLADGRIGISLNETVTNGDLHDIVQTFVEGLGDASSRVAVPATRVERLPLRRTRPFLTHPTFNTHQSETAMMRYIRRLERKDLGLDTSMIPLGSCTMKLNAATEMRPLTWEAVSRIHPFAPPDQTRGYQRLIEELEAALCTLTGFAAVSLQPNSGAQGEFAGLLVIRAFQRASGQGHRDVVLIPASAHGTNPASAVMAGLRVVVVATAADGSVDVEDLRAKAAANREALACLMVTYPSTHGVFEDGIRELCAIVHAAGGQVYMDGANMNAQVGLTSPATIGADVCHLNLHKTFAIPHGGGGPGMGPIGVAAHLAPYLPGHHVLASGSNATHPVSAAPWGSASILLISYGYIRLLGGSGLTDATRHAILNANYLKTRLAPHYPVLYAGRSGRVAHEVIFDLRGFKSAGVDEMDVAKRLIDYGFHAPTVSFPVAGTLMVEPTESEDLGELDRFCDAMIRIRAEIETVASGAAHPTDNVLKQAPHTLESVVSTTWTHPYSREEAAFPLPFVRANKFWPSVGRIDNPYGDRNLVCTCPPMDQYA